MFPLGAVVVAGVLAVACPYWAPGITWLPLAVLLGGLAVLITHRAVGETSLTRLIGASFAIRCVLTVGLFTISSLHLPILRSLQLGPGLWEFGGDGGGHHEQALWILEAWRAGIDLNSIFVMQGAYEYKGPALLIAMVYGVFGPVPLHFMLVNAWVGAMSGLLAYLLAARLGDRRSAMLAAGLVAFWPSSVLWSTQLMRDSAQLGLCLSALLLLTALWQRYSIPSRFDRRAMFTVGAWWVGLGGAVFGFTYFRNYLGILLAISVALVMATALGRALWRRQLKEALAAVGITAAVGVSTLLGVSVDLYAVLSPRHPEIGHVRRGDGFRAQHQLESAVASYRRAITLNPAYAPAYRALGLMLMERGDQAGAMEALNHYLSLEPDRRQRDELTAKLNAYAIPRMPGGTGAAGGSATSSVAVAVQPHALATASERAITVTRSVLSFMSVEALGRFRRVQVGVGGTSLIDPTVDFKTAGDVLAYLPRAFVIAYLAPFPWQWFYTSGASGVMRPVAGFEVLLIILFIPAIVAGFWRRARRFRPEEWMLITFVAAVAICMGLMMPNMGTLFRLRLQFLIPTLILASSALPAFVYRWFDRVSPPAQTCVEGVTSSV